MRRNNLASTSFQRHVPTRFLINQCQMITFLILKSDNIENSRIELKGIVLPVSSNQIKVTIIIILPFNLVHLWFFPVSHRNWRKMWVDYWGAKGYVAPPPLSQIIGGGGGAGPPGPPCSYAYALYLGHRRWKVEHIPFLLLPYPSLFIASTHSLLGWQIELSSCQTEKPGHNLTTNNLLATFSTKHH